MRTLICCALLAATLNLAWAAPERDPAAYSLLKEAHDNRDTWSADFPGFTADVLLNDNGTEVKGTLTYPAAGKMTLALNGASKPQEEWAREELGSALGHRRPDDWSKGDGSQAITFLADDHSPLGREVTLNDRFKSAYRIRDGRLVQVTRNMGPQRFTITVLETQPGEGGRYLPTEFTVTFFDASTGALKRVDAYSDRFVRVGGAWVPISRRVVTAENGGFTTRSFTLENIRVLGAGTTTRR